MTRTQRLQSITFVFLGLSFVGQISDRFYGSDLIAYTTILFATLTIFFGIKAYSSSRQESQNNG